MEEIRITELKDAEIDRSRKTHLYNCKAVLANGGIGNLEFQIETNHPVFLDSGKIGFADPNAFGARFKVIEVKCNNGSGRYIDDIRKYFESEYSKFTEKEEID